MYTSFTNYRTIAFTAAALIFLVGILYIFVLMRVEKENMQEYVSHSHGDATLFQCSEGEFRAIVEDAVVHLELPGNRPQTLLRIESVAGAQYANETFVLTVSENQVSLDTEDMQLFSNCVGVVPHTTPAEDPLEGGVIGIPAPPAPAGKPSTPSQVPGFVPGSGGAGDTTPAPGPSPQGCYRGGCSGQVCSDDPNAMSTCEWTPAYACYREVGLCERQVDGECGWTMTDELRACLDNPPE